MTTATSITIRPATRDDVPAIRDIYNDVILHTTAVYHYQPLPLEERLAWFDAKRAHDLPIFVADDHGAVVGFSTFGAFRPAPAYLHTVENTVHVHPDRRGQGIGSLLMPPLLEVARERRIHAVIAGIDSAGEASIRLHARFGFQKVAHLRAVGFKFERWLDLVLMELLLDA